MYIPSITRSSQLHLENPPHDVLLVKNSPCTFKIHSFQHTSNIYSVLLYPILVSEQKNPLWISPFSWAASPSMAIDPHFIQIVDTSYIYIIKLNSKKQDFPNYASQICILVFLFHDPNISSLNIPKTHMHCWRWSLYPFVPFRISTFIRRLNTPKPVALVLLRKF